MTMPLMNEPLITKDRLSVWIKQPIEDDDDVAFADELIAAVSILVRLYGDPSWSIDTDPPFFPARADTIAITVAKNYWQNPKLLSADTVGPLTERWVEAYVNNITLTAEQKAELDIAAGRDPGEVGSGTGLWTLRTTSSYSEPSVRALRYGDTPRYWP